MQVKILIFVFIALTILQPINGSHTKYRKCYGKYVCKSQYMSNWFRRGVCIDLVQLCNGLTECPQGEDEDGCTCPILTRPKNGDVLSDGLEANYTCDPGFEMIGEPTRTCLPSYSWNGSEPLCFKSDPDDSLECLACNGVKTVDECQEVVKCNRDEVACYMVTYMSDSNVTFVDFGFAESESCPVNGGPLVFGPPMEDNIQCTKCCLEGEYCNRQLNCTAPERFSRECSDIKDVNPSATSGVYIIYPDGTLRSAVAAYCDMFDLNAWTVFQRRLDGSVDFYRNWSTYKYGFGSPFGEYWLGNDDLHEITTYSPHELRVDLRDFEGSRTYAEYSTFSVGNESSDYVVSISGFSGNVENDCLTSGRYPINDMKFSTYDRDNDDFDVPFGNCAQLSKGGWWYKDCHCANLNGQYLAGFAFTGKGINWSDYNYSLKYVTMKVRKLGN